MMCDVVHRRGPNDCVKVVKSWCDRWNIVMTVVYQSVWREPSRRGRPARLQNVRGFRHRGRIECRVAPIGAPLGDALVVECRILMFPDLDPSRVILVVTMTTPTTSTTTTIVSPSSTTTTTDIRNQKDGNFLTRSKPFRLLVDKAFAVCDGDKTGHICKTELYAGLLLVHRKCYVPYCFWCDLLL